MSNPTNQLSESKQSYLPSLVRDVFCVGALGVLLLCIHDLASPFVRGFYCDDATIRYPYKESTVSSGLCYLAGTGLNIGLILILEYLNLVKKSQSTSNRDASRRFQVRLYLRNVGCRILVWMFGAISSELLTDISKFTAGRLRPHFIDVCRPVVVKDGQDVGLEQFCNTQIHSYTYINSYRCTSGSPRKLRDSRLSFMSGHSSYSAYSAAHAVFYIQSNLDMTKVGLMKPALQVLILSTAFYTGLTRVSDYKHHWQDVLAGLLQGTTVAAIVCWYLWPSFYKTYSRFLEGYTQPQVGETETGDELNRVSY